MKNDDLLGMQVLGGQFSLDALGNEAAGVLRVARVLADGVRLLLCGPGEPHVPGAQLPQQRKFLLTLLRLFDLQTAGIWHKKQV